MLEVVQHQQHLPVGQEAPQRRRGRPGFLQLRRQRDGDRGGQLARIGQRRQRDEVAPSAKSAASRRATSIASRVLPTPPGPISVTSRASTTSSAKRSSSASRPNSDVDGTR